MTDVQGLLAKPVVPLATAGRTKYRETQLISNNYIKVTNLLWIISGLIAKSEHLYLINA